MSTAPTTSPPAALPPDPTLTTLRARVLQSIAEASAKLGCAPGTVSAGQDSTGRHGSMYFDTINEAGAWADWLHWPWSATGRDGTHTLTAYGRWLGFSWQIIASEPLVPEAAPVHREV